MQGWLRGPAFEPTTAARAHGRRIDKDPEKEKKLDDYRSVSALPFVIDFLSCTVINCDAVSDAVFPFSKPQQLRGVCLLFSAQLLPCLAGQGVDCVPRRQLQRVRSIMYLSWTTLQLWIGDVSQVG
jgi:hypothetical protein